MARYVTKDGVTMLVEKCAVDISLADVIDAQVTLAIAKFEHEFEDRIENPSLYCDIEDIDIEAIPSGLSGCDLFPKQPEPLIVKNNSYLVPNYNYRPTVYKRHFDTRYFRLIEIKPDNG